MKLKNQMLIAPLSIAALLAASVALSAWLIETTRETAATTHEAVLAAQAGVARMRDGIATEHMRLYRTMTIVGSLDEPAVRKVRSQINSELAQAAGRARGSLASAATDETLAQGLKSLEGAIAAYAKEVDNALDMASIDPNTGVAALQTVEERFAQLSAKSAALGKLVQEVGQKQDAQASTATRRVEGLLGAIGLTLAIGAALFAAAVTRRIVGGVEQAADAARRVAAGDLDVRLQSSTRDEVGDMTRALADMVLKLRDSLHTVRQAADSINSASSEIANGNLDLSNRTEQTASNLQQTAASMEQFNSTVQQSEQASRQASELAATAAGIAQRGGSVVGDVVRTMNEIQDSSARISQIIAVIDGIAFQTNILALNAAVEAARAGEQGRGFAVVATEVRTLAQRSAQAAQEIKNLIGNSVDKVEAGSRLVKDAGQTMSEIVSSVNRVSAIIHDMSRAATEQASGISQVNAAVSQLDGMTQQNAALVEQSAASAQSLSDQARRLRDVVGGFRLGGAA